MNDRDRFNATMHYQSRDRSPICDFSFWDETLVVWYDQGLPREVTFDNCDTYFGMDYGLDTTFSGVSANIRPLFDEVTLEDHGDHEIVQQADGVRVLRKKFMGSIPQHQSHLLVDRDSWEKYYKPRLDPDNPARFPADWDNRVRSWRDPARSNVVTLPGGSLYGWIRNWMGMENVSLLVYDDPALFEEMVTTIADCILGVLSRMLATGGYFDAVEMWEDMCYKAGPLLSPRHFQKFMVPHYRRISDLARSHGVDVLWVDSDGKVDDLIPLWLDAGINCMFPIEVGTWGADPVAYRKKYGRDLLMMGGFDKRILAQSKADIEVEVRRLAPLVEEGGFICFCDHRVPPDVSLENYMFYLDRVRAIWGQNINLKPIGRLPRPTM